MTLMSGRRMIWMLVFGVVCSSTGVATAGPWYEQAKLVPGDGMEGDWFGNSVSVSGDLAIVGAPVADIVSERTGAAYIYQRDGIGWSELIKLVPDDGVGSDYFGLSVAISGSAAIVGAYGQDVNGDRSGAAYLFEDRGTGWTQMAKLLPEDGDVLDQFGTAVSISGNTAIVGAFGNDDHGDRSGSAYIFEDDGSGWQQIAKLAPEDGQPRDYFGGSVSISGDTAIIGSRGSDEGSDDSGSAYIYRDDGSQWQQVTKLVPNDSASVDHFGRSVSISGDTAVISKTNDAETQDGSASAYIFRESDSSWSQVAKLVSDETYWEDHFGSSVSIDGDTVVVGADLTQWRDDAEDPFTVSGMVYVFEETDSGWTTVGTLLSSDAQSYDRLGESVSLSGNTVFVGAPVADGLGDNSGSAYVFAVPEPSTVWLLLIGGLCLLLWPPGRRVARINLVVTVLAMLGSLTTVATAGPWYEQARLVPEVGPMDNFGVSVAIDGDTLLVGRDNEDLSSPEDSGPAYVFQLSGSTWTQAAALLPDDGAGDSQFSLDVALSGRNALVGAFLDDTNGLDSGAAYIFEDISLAGDWSEVVQTKLLPSDGEVGELFGSAIAISGNTAIVGAARDDVNGSKSGSAYIFEDNGSGWAQVGKLLPHDGAIDDHFGSSVSISGETAIVGANGNDDNGPWSGSAYIFEDDGTGWSEVTKLLPDDGAEHDVFGSVSISGNTAIVGARNDDDNGDNSGSAYVFQDDGTGWNQVTKLLAEDGTEFDQFGKATAIRGNTAIIGATGYDILFSDGGDPMVKENAGSAYIFEDTGSGWTQIDSMHASDFYDSYSQGFGFSVSIDDDSAAVGWWAQDYDGTDPAAAYVFAVPEPSSILTLLSIALPALLIHSVRRNWKWRAAHP